MYCKCCCPLDLKLMALKNAIARICFEECLGMEYKQRYIPIAKVRDNP